MQHLELRHQTYHCVVDVPRPLRVLLGKKRFVQSLQMHDLIVAQARRWDVIAKFRRSFEEARPKVGGNPAVEAGLAWRSTLAQVEAGDEGAIAALWGYSGGGYRAGDTPQEIARDHASHSIDAMVDHLLETKGDAAASTFLDVAHGRATPLLHFLDAWLSEGGRQGTYQARTRRQMRSDLDALGGWADTARVPGTLEAFTRQIVGRFVQERLAASGANRKTINRKISAASSYWTWLIKRGHLTSNPWERQSLAKASNGSQGERERPFTDEEVARLLTGPADAELADLMHVAALTGARIEAIYRLTVKACAGGWFVFAPQKKEPRPRRVPMHSALLEIVKRRCEGKRPGDFLFHEAGAANKLNERSTAASKRFGHYRQRAGVDVHERPEGVRRSLVNFHSWRRWMATKAEQAGQPIHIISAVTGHVEGARAWS